MILARAVDQFKRINQGWNERRCRKLNRGDKLDVAWVMVISLEFILKDFSKIDREDVIITILFAIFVQLVKRER